MKIVVNHLTRMQNGYICVAGLDTVTGRHVRPIPENDRLRRTRLVRHGGLFDIASRVDLGRTSYVGKAPETEDYRFDPRRARRIDDSASQEFWTLLKSASCTSLAELFGPALRRHGDACTVDVGTGTASLGCLLLSQPPTLLVSSNGKVRLHLDDGTISAWLSVTDLRLYRDDHSTPRREAVQCIAQRIAHGTGVILAVGLSRPWCKPGDTVERHWLQVNNIHLEDDPTWQDCSLAH